MPLHAVLMQSKQIEAIQLRYSGMQLPYGKLPAQRKRQPFQGLVVYYWFRKFQQLPFRETMNPHRFEAEVKYHKIY